LQLSASLQDMGSALVILVPVRKTMLGLTRQVGDGP
jgi:hypothetical protein